MADNKNYTEKIAVKLFWEEYGLDGFGIDDYNQSGDADCDFICDTLEQGIMVLKGIKETYVKRIAQEVEERNLTFNAKNLLIKENYGENRHFNPNIKLTYTDDKEALTLTYGAELRTTNYIDPRLNDVDTINKMIEKYYL